MFYSHSFFLESLLCLTNSNFENPAQMSHSILTSPGVHTSMIKLQLFLCWFFLLSQDAHCVICTSEFISTIKP